MESEASFISYCHSYEREKWMRVDDCIHYRTSESSSSLERQQLLL